MFSSGSGRVEMFSDAVFAIAITLLVLDLPVPSGPGLFEAVLDDWASFLAYLAAFLTLASMWVHHHVVFSRVRRVEPAIILLNLLLLFGVALEPWPTRLLSEAIGDGDHADGVLACMFYAVVGLILIAAWAGMTGAFSRRPHLLRGKDSAAFMRRSADRVLLAAVPTVAAVALALVSPVISLALFIAMPLYFLVWTAHAPRVSARSKGGNG